MRNTFTWLLQTMIIALFCTTMPVVAQVNYTLQDKDVIIDQGYLLNCRYDFSANTDGTNLTIPDTLQKQAVKGTIGGSWMIHGLFSHRNIVSLALPATLEDIGAWTFSFNHLKQVIIPASVSHIGEGAFNDNAIISVNGKTSTGIIYSRNREGNNDSTTIISYGGASKNIDFIPHTVISIGSWSFGQMQLSRVILPNSIDSINYGAFSMNFLADLDIPNSVTFIGMNAFTDNKLTRIHIPFRVTHIGFGAFGNNLLEEATFEKGFLKTIEGRAFTNNQLSEIIIPGSVETMGYEAFYENKISSVVLEEGSLSKIEGRVFHHNLIDRFTLPSHENTLGFDGWVDGDENNIGGPPYVATNLQTSYTAKGLTNAMEYNNDFIEKSQVYPNPVKNRLFIHIPDNCEVEKVSVSNSIGIVFQTQDILSLLQIDMSRYPKGLYFIILKNKNGNVQTFKVIKT